MKITRDVLVDIMRTPDLKDKHAGFVGFEDIHNWTWCYDKSRLGSCNNVYSMQEVQRLYALGIPTETPEEKEVMDGIESAGWIEWNGEGLPPVGVECEAVFIDHEHKGYGEFLILGYHSNYVWMEYIGKLRNKSKHYTAKINMVKFRKPETPQQREDRERLEAAYDLYCHIAKMNNRVPYSFEQFSNDSTTYYRKEYLEIVCKTNYRKEKTHATN
ncbi:putative coil containing protein [Vibrio phage 217E38-1]|nr:putative coil containing protein [Vibrio phage 217E38-1]